MCDSVDDRVSANEHLCGQWEDYEREYDMAKAWVDSREDCINQLMLDSDNPAGRHANLQNTRVGPSTLAICKDIYSQYSELACRICV